MSSLCPGLLAQMACILEVTARKPGNVHPERGFADLTHLDFLLSAAAIATPLDQARNQSVGATILAAVEATRAVVASNTNLGMILLLAPLAAVPAGVDLKTGVRDVLDRLTIDDARLAYRAIRIARPGGLGQVASQDVQNEPTITLRDAMRLAADRDLIARQYTNSFAEVFDLTAHHLRTAIQSGASLETAIIQAFLETLAVEPDSLIVRKSGPEVASEASRRAAWALETGETKFLDTWLREPGARINPGTTADLVAAALFVVLHDGTLTLPRPAGPHAWSGLPSISPPETQKN